MILVVDSGSTKTDWIALDKEGSIIFSTQTLGMNPQVLSSSIISERIINNFDLYKNRDSVNKIFFYGAGCGVSSSINRIRKVFEGIFKKCDFDIKEDTYAAVFSTINIGEKAIVCILGTGSNCTYYNGNDIEQKIISLGYSLMDEASGNFFGKQLIRSYYFNEMDPDIAKVFENKYDLRADVIKENLYRKENPNAYLASFSKFLITNKDYPVFQKIIYEGLNRFINHQIMQFEDCRDIPIHFVGSVAHYLKNEIKESLLKKGLKMGNVVQRPIDKLVNYHIELLK
jgi:N-acetylglucosamine kinase-like BadF-type ATPase